jgi:hypothetical protein
MALDFWLGLVAFLAGVLRVPVAILQLTGILAADAPRWYVSFQGLLGILQLAIGLAMVAGYRRAGVWGTSEPRAWEAESTRFRSGAFSFPACSARSTTRSMFYLVLPGPTLTVDPF